VLGLPGNTADVAVAARGQGRPARLAARPGRHRRGPPVLVQVEVDYLRRARGHWIAGERMRDGNPRAQAALSRQGRYRQVRDNLRVEEVTLPGESGVRWIVCHNPAEAERDATRRQEALSRLTAELDRIKQARMRDAERRKAGKKTPSEQVHVKAECALRDHPALGRWLRQLPSGRLVLDKTKIAAEERLDGKYLLSTSDPDLSAEDVALGYKTLLEAERGFRDLKSTLDLRPVFHRIEPRIRAHVLLCWLALLLIRVAERRTGLTWRRIEIELGRLHAVNLTGSAGTVVQTTPRHPSRHSSRLPDDPAAPRHHAALRLTSANSASSPTHRRRHTPSQAAITSSRRSHGMFGMITCLPTAEAGGLDHAASCRPPGGLRADAGGNAAAGAIAPDTSVNRRSRPPPAEDQDEVAYRVDPQQVPPTVAVCAPAGCAGPAPDLAGAVEPPQMAVLRLDGARPPGAGPALRS
jgi:hypothetical protein